MDFNENYGRTKGLKKVVFRSEQPVQYVNEILDKYQVMAFLNISERTLRTYVSEGYLVRSVIRGKSYYRYSDLLEMLERFRER